MKSPCGTCHDQALSSVGPPGGARVTCPCRACLCGGHGAFRDRGWGACGPCRHAGRRDPSGGDAARRSRGLPGTGDRSPEDPRVGCSAGLPLAPTPRVPVQMRRWRRGAWRAQSPGRGCCRPWRQAVRQYHQQLTATAKRCIHTSLQELPGTVAFTSTPKVQTPRGGVVARLEAARTAGTGLVGRRRRAGMINSVLLRRRPV